MRGPEPGRYIIKLLDGPEIGVDFGPQPVKPVLTDAPDRVWTVNKVEDGKYTFTLRGGRPVYIKDMEGSLVGTHEEPPFIWAVQEREGGLYTIEVPHGIIETKGWTVEHHPGPQVPVTLDMILVIPGPRRNQLWRFIPVDDD